MAAGVVSHGKAGRATPRVCGVGRAEKHIDLHGPAGEVLRLVEPEPEVQVVVNVSLLRIGQNLGQPAEVVTLGLVEHRDWYR